MVDIVRPPSGEALGVRDATAADCWRAGWWALKSVTKPHLKLYLLFVIAAAMAIGILVSMIDPIAGIIASVCALLLAAVLTVVLTFFFTRAIARSKAGRVYVGDSAIMSVVASPDRWSIAGHASAHPKRGLGGMLRGRIIDGLLSAATDAGVDVVGYSANARLQRHYLSSLEQRDFNAGPKNTVVWFHPSRRPGTARVVVSDAAAPGTTPAAPDA